MIDLKPDRQKHALSGLLWRGVSTLRRERRGPARGGRGAVAALAPARGLGEKARMSALRNIRAARAAHALARDLRLPAPRGVARWACVAALAGALAACSSAKEMVGFPQEVAESPEVSTAAWPRLIDAPAPAPRLDEEADEQRRRGQTLEAEMEAEAAALQAEADKMMQQPVVRGNLQHEAAEVRARNAALDAADRSSSDRKIRLDAVPGQEAAPDAGAPVATTAPAAGTTAASDAAPAGDDDLDAKIRAELEAIAAEARAGASDAGAAADDAAAAPNKP